ncbi:hypothetical protein [Sediminimonas qiaohouensis]|uniref:hypothetical protein n=1 Tax=Sediminimonas qiaohouensis TaxID=552061 RepID=UPI0023571502|nr:hypothetical protein [Sediminimonas qiaohouensis]
MAIPISMMPLEKKTKFKRQTPTAHISDSKGNIARDSELPLLQSRISLPALGGKVQMPLPTPCPPVTLTLLK